jgi:hypothetical protein
MDAESAWATLASVSDGSLSVGLPEVLLDESDDVAKLSFAVSINLNATELQSSVGERLLAWADRHSAPVAFDVLVSLPEPAPDCPAAPPELRLLRPLLVPGTGGVLNGAFVRLPSLLPAGWDPYVGLPQVRSWVRESLWEHAATPLLETGGTYAVDAYRATRDFILRGKPLPAAHAHSSGFVQSYTAFSSTWAVANMRATVPPGFHAGNKLLLPSSALELLVRSELNGADGRALVGFSPLSSALPLSMLAMGAGPEASSVSDSAMVFELTGPLGYPVYAGVREFTSPEPGVVILPPSLLLEAGLSEGSKVNLVRVVLPPLETVVLQPHSSNFEAVEAFTGVPPREFLEASLTSYACLQPGLTILCDGGADSGEVDSEGFPVLNEQGDAGGPAFHFTVVSVKPDSLHAAGLFVGFQSQVNISFLPALDSCESPPVAGLLPSTASRASAEATASMVGAPAPHSASAAAPAPGQRLGASDRVTGAGTLADLAREREARRLRAQGGVRR